MNTLIKIVFLLMITFSGSSFANDEPLAFFQMYVHLGEEFDPAVADLYSDQALIHAYRVYPHGLERSMAMTGVQWKKILIKIMPLAKSQNDKSTFSNIEITKFNEGYKIKADRYSVRKCYTDTGYYMVIKLLENGTMGIVEEYMETKPLPNC